MKKVTYELVIDSISEIHGEYPGSVDVSFHLEGGDLATGQRDGFESTRVALSDAVINVDGSINAARIESEVVAKVGSNETVEVE